MVIAPAAPYAGTQTWAADFLPGCHQGTHVVPGPTPIPNVRPRPAPGSNQRRELELITRADRKHAARRTGDDALEARNWSFETAFGKQSEAPAAFYLSGETDATLAFYGLQRGRTTGFGWQCLVARRLAERGVRLVELIETGSPGNWDSHGNIQDHAGPAKNADQPIAGLLTELKQRGMLEDTLVVWTTEFGRTPTTSRPATPAASITTRRSPPGWPAAQGAGSSKGRPTTTAWPWPGSASTSMTSTPRSYTCSASTTNGWSTATPAGTTASPMSAARSSGRSSRDEDEGDASKDPVSVDDSYHRPVGKRRGRGTVGHDAEQTRVVAVEHGGRTAQIRVPRGHDERPAPAMATHYCGTQPGEG